MEYEGCCAILKRSPFQKRRLYFSLMECYKCIFSLNNFSNFKTIKKKINKKIKIKIKKKLKKIKKKKPVANIHFWLEL